MARVILIVFLFSLTAHAAEYFVWVDDETSRTNWSSFAPTHTTNYVVLYERPVDPVTPPLQTTFENGIAIPGDDGHWYSPEVDDGELLPVQISNSPLDPATAAVMREAAKQARRAARQEWRTVTMGVKTGVVQAIRDTRAMIQGNAGLVDRATASLVSGSTVGSVKTGHNDSVALLRDVIKDNRERDRIIRDLSIQVRELTDIVRQKNLNVYTKSEPKE